MGTMLQRYDLGHRRRLPGARGLQRDPGRPRPDVVAAIHDAYYAVGVDAVETNTFGANWSNLSDYGIDDRITELAAAGARIARERAEAAEADDGRMRWVLDRWARVPSCRASTHDLRASEGDVRAAGRGAHRRGADAFLVETSQDLLQTKAAINGCKQAIVARGIRHVDLRRGDRRDDRHDAHGLEIGAALTALEPLGVDAIGLNCATGPAEMSEHLRHPSRSIRP